MHRLRPRGDEGEHDLVERLAFAGGLGPRAERGEGDRREEGGDRERGDELEEGECGGSERGSGHGSFCWVVRCVGSGVGPGGACALRGRVSRVGSVAPLEDEDGVVDIDAPVAVDIGGARGDRGGAGSGDDAEDHGGVLDIDLAVAV